jgi:hypothetical protein
MHFWYARLELELLDAVGFGVAAMISFMPPF